MPTQSIKIIEMLIILNRENSQVLNTASRLAMGPTQPPIQWIPGVL